MRIISIDVGIRNLGICILENQRLPEKYIIHFWENIDIFESGGCNTLLKRGARKNKECNKTGLYTIGDDIYCRTHYNAFMKNKHCCGGKKDYCKLPIKYHDECKYYCKRHRNGIEIFKQKSVKETTMDEICVNVIKKLDSLRDVLFQDIDRVIIEYQPNIATLKIKSMSHILYTYFVIRGIIDNPYIVDKKVLLVSAKNKLLSIDPKKASNYKRGKKGYSTRKKASVENCDELLNRFIKDENIRPCSYGYFLNKLHSSNKKDDLADSFLQGYWYIKGK